MFRLMDHEQLFIPAHVLARDLDPEAELFANRMLRKRVLEFAAKSEERASAGIADPNDPPFVVTDLIDA